PDRRKHDLNTRQSHHLDAGRIETKRPTRSKLRFKFVQQSLGRTQIQNRLELDGSILLHGSIVLVLRAVCSSTRYGFAAGVGRSGSFGRTRAAGREELSWHLFE